MSGSLRVLYLPPASFDPGKASRYSFLDEEIRALAAAGVDAFVPSWGEKAPRDEGRVHLRPIPDDSMESRVGAASFWARHPGCVPWRNALDPVQLYRSLRIERFCARLARQERVDLVHSFFGWPRGYGGQLVKAHTGLPLVAGLRGSDINVLPDHKYGARLDPSFDRTMRSLLASADKTISVSAFLRRQAIDAGAHPDRATVILKGVRLDLFDPARRDEARAALGVGNGRLILTVAGLVAIKGIADILAALARLRATGSAFRHIVCGDGPERERLTEMAASLGLGERVQFLGKVSRDSIRDYFAAADVLVHGALIEASGNVLLEAMSAGLPVVCTDAGGPAEYVVDGRTGFVVPVGDSAALAGGIEAVLTNEILRRDFGVAARKLAVQRFSYDRMIRETLDIYETMVPRGTRQEPE